MVDKATATGAKIRHRYFVSNFLGSLHYFLYRMSRLKVKFGIILSKNGITGTEETAATRLISDSYHASGQVCIVLTLADLKNFGKHNLFQPSTTFMTLLLSKYDEFRFGKPKEETTKAKQTQRSKGSKKT